MAVHLSFKSIIGNNVNGIDELIIRDMIFRFQKSEKERQRVGIRIMTNL